MVSDQASNATGTGSEPPAASDAKRTAPWVRWLSRAVMVASGIFAVLMIVGTIMEFGKVPKCDAKTIKDSLSDFNKRNQFNASAYNFIRETGRTETEATCKANLALRAGGTAEYDFRIYKEESKTMIAFGEVSRQ
jgi:hypothetical protein